MTPGSWWRHPKTGQRLIVPKWFGSMLVRDGYRYCKGRFRPGIYHGEGQPPGRLPAYQEGAGLYLAWLLPDELRATWKRYRPAKRVIPPPSWVTTPLGEINEFVLDGKTFVGVQGIRGNIICLTGVCEEKEGETWRGWGQSRFTTLFIETGEAKARLAPRYAKIRETSWDKLVGDDWLSV